MEVIYLKKIKLFFIRNYQRFIRFLISLSVVSVLVFGTLTTSAAVSVYGSFPFSQPPVTSNWGYVEALNANGGVELYIFNVNSLTSSYANLVNSSDVEFYYDSVNKQVGFRYTAFNGDGNPLGNAIVTAWYVYPNGTYDQFWYQQDFYDCRKTRGNVNGIVSAHVYGCKNSFTSSGREFMVTYGSDNLSADKLQVLIDNLAKSSNVTQSQLEAILRAIKDNKSSAEKSDYTSPDTSNASQYEAAESDLMDSTSSGRSSAVDTMKGIGGILDNHVGKSLLATSKLMSEFLGIPWLSDIVHFSLVCGLFAFVLGISVMIISSFGNWHVASRYSSVDSNSHRKRLGK